MNHANQNHGTGTDPAAMRVAYFSMEFGVDPRLPIYAGGLGVLAGDTLRAFADLKMRVVAVTLLYRKGYFEQVLDDEGNQIEREVSWNPGGILRSLAPTASVSIAGREVVVRASRYDVTGPSGHVVPLILLDTDVPENDSEARFLTGSLYGGDDRYRLSQEIVLGIGGVRMLKALGYTGLEHFHMNEGHASLIALELLREEPQPPDGGDEENQSEAAALWRQDIEDVRQKCVFTTHTPVPAGHDQFSYDLVAEVLTEAFPHAELRRLGGDERLNMTSLALNLSHFINGVAKRHREVSQEMFPGFAIDAITNGVHSVTWTSPGFCALYDRLIPGWRADSFSLRYAINLPRPEVWDAHLIAKRVLLDEVRKRSGADLPLETFTLGFARRAASYKRADLIFQDLDTLAAVARVAGPVQLILAGKAHPKDILGKELIRRVFAAAKALKGRVEVVYLANYDMRLAGLLTAGVDVWLNTPLPPQEASGTSGMKAAHNGVPSLSVLDGWWIEGHVEGVTGWSIGATSPQPDARLTTREEIDRRDAGELYEKLGRVILPLFYQDRPAWCDVMRRTIAFNASFFNAHRMVQQYAASAYV